MKNLCGTENTKFDFANSYGVDTKHQDLINLSLRGDCVTSSETYINDEFLGKCYNLQNLYIEPMEEITTINKCFLYYNYRIQDVDMSMFPNLKTIDSNSFLKKCYDLTSFDFSPINNSENLVVHHNSGGDPGFCDNWNLISLNLANLRVNNFDAGGYAFCVRTNIGVPSYALGCLVTGTEAEAFVVKYNKYFGTVNVSHDSEDAIAMYVKFLFIKIWAISIRILGRNLRVTTI